MSRGDSLSRVVSHLRRRRLVADGDRVLLGLGGGVASAGMLAAFIMGREGALPRCELSVAAVETDPSEEHDGAEVVAEVGRVARSFGLPFFAVRPAMHRVARCGSRDGALEALAAEQGYTRIALAHTRDDEVRRVLRGLSADEGLRGVQGISSRGVGGVIRPVLPLPGGRGVGARAGPGHRARDAPAHPRGAGGGGARAGAADPLARAGAGA